MTNYFSVLFFLEHDFTCISLRRKKFDSCTAKRTETTTPGEMPGSEEKRIKAWETRTTHHQRGLLAKGLRDDDLQGPEPCRHPQLPLLDDRSDHLNGAGAEVFEGPPVALFPD
jgi:hypothetical protein